MSNSRADAVDAAADRDAVLHVAVLIDDRLDERVLRGVAGFQRRDRVDQALRVEVRDVEVRAERGRDFAADETLSGRPCVRLTKCVHVIVAKLRS